MARFLEDYKPKKKKKEETTQKKAQSPSVSKPQQNRVKQAQEQKTYGGVKPQTVKRSNAGSAKSAAQDRQQTTSQPAQKTLDRLQQKYGGTQPGSRTQTRTTASSARQRNANDNLYLKQSMLQKNQEQREERRQVSNQRRLEAQRQKSGLNDMPSKETQEATDRAIRNTPSLVKKAVLDTVQGHGQTLADLTEMTASSKTGAKAKAMKMGIDPEKDKAQMAEVERERQRTAEAARLDREKWAKEQDERQQEWDKKVNGAGGLEKAYYGAVESGTGMLTDLAIGLGSQGGSLAAMFSRTYGTTRGQAEKEGATEGEDRTYAFLQAAKEVGTELMFPGVGLAKGYAGKAGLPMAERVANNLTQRIANRTAADVTGAGVRLIGGTAEENLEEVAGFGLDPLIKEFSYGRNVRTRQKVADLQNESDQLRANIQSDEDARRVASYLSSSEWLEQNKAQYKEAGLNDKDAQEVAEMMRDYMTASLTGDTETMDMLEQEIAGTLSKGEFSYKKSLDKSELLDTLASTTLLTMTTGLPGTASTAMRGSVIRDNLGEDGIRTLAESAMNYEDEEASKRGEVARDRLNSGQELTATQVYELATAQAQQVEKDTQRVVAKNNVVADTLESEKLVAPMIMRDEQGNIHGDAVITQRYNESAQEAENVLKDLDKEQKLSLSDSELAVGSRAIAGFQTGAFTINDANALNYTNTAVRDAFEKVTGVDLGQYVVKTPSGAVDYAATNAATKDALFTMAADNFIETARAETENFKDITKGITAEQMAARVGSNGDMAISTALDTVDPADEDTYGLMASAAQNVYEYGRYTEDSWDDVSGRLSEMYPGLSQEALQDVYEAAKRDKTIAETPYYNAKVTAGESTSEMDMSEAEQVEYGKFTNDTGKDIGMKERAVLESMASEFNINIRLLPSEFFEYKYTDRNGKEKTAYSNGSYDPKTGTMLLNGGNDMERNIIAVALHEVTHHIAIYAPTEYLALSNRVMEAWYKNDADAFNAAIQRKQENYKVQVKQNLSEEQALEEVIADAMGEMSSDPDFISQICTEEPTLAEQIINAIKSVLRKLRAIMASGNVAEEHEDAFFNQLGIWDDAQRLWMQAAKVAQQQRANQMIDDWDAQARQNTSEQETIEDVAENLEPKEKFSVNEPVERVKDLIAVHNLKPQDLINTFDLGGFPMPSIAVTKDSMGHDMYGDITLMFHSDTIDPEKRRTNEVFGGDAYTPVFPRIHYKASSKVEDRLSDLYYEWSQKYGYDTVRPFYEYGQTLQDALDRAGGEAALIDQLKSDSNLMRMYLRINDNDVEDVMKITEITMPEGEVDLSKRLIDALGEEDIRSIVPEGVTGREALQYRREWVEAHKEQLEAVYRDYFTSSGVLSEEDIEAVIPEIKPGEYAVAVRKALDYLRHGATTTKEEKDYEATTNAIKQAAEETGYDEWIDDLFKGVEEKRGLRNDRDMFTASGNRRKWESLHEPVTLNGVVRVMSQELSAGANGLLGANPKGASQKSYKSLDEIRADEDRLQQLPEEEFKALEEAAVQKLSDVCGDIVDSNSDAFQNRFGAVLDVGEYIAEILNVTKNRATIKRKLQSDYNLKVTDSQMDALMEAIDEIANLPTGYFEAKPRRAVEFNEVKAAILPAAKDNDEYARIRSGLESRGVPIYEYDTDKEGDRANVLNQAATENNLRFSLNDESRVMYTPKGIEVVQNPTDSEYNSMREEILAEYPWLRGTGEPLLRHTYDESGNEYYWNAFDGMHRDVEPYINRQYNTRTSQQWKWYEKPDKDDYPTDYSKQGYRFSITDAEGNTLSEGQAAFFADSKMVDTEGRLKPMYHGTQNEFFEFDITKAYPGTLGRGFYFADSDSHAGVYGKTNKYYLNLVNPLMPGTNTITKAQLHRFVSELAEDEDYGIENYGYGATVDSVVNSVWGKSDFAMLRDLNLTAVGDFAEAIKVFNRVNDTDYDGIITDTETIAFYPQQVKSVDNLNPTLSKDTRYSITDSDGKELSDGQVDYFKDSQARDSEGKLQVVYHTTNKGGFTVFDPSYSDDRRSLFFASNWNVSQTYGRRANNPIDINRGDRDVTLDEFLVMDGQANIASLMSSRIIELRDTKTGALQYPGGDYLKAGQLLRDWYDSKGKDYPNIGVDVPYQPSGGESLLDYNGFVLWMNDMVKAQDLKQHGYYSVYLNLENPLIVDAEGHSWNAIPYGSNEGMSYEDYREAQRDKYDSSVIDISIMQHYDDEWSVVESITIEATIERKDSEGNWYLDEPVSKTISIDLDTYRNDEGEPDPDMSYSDAWSGAEIYMNQELGIPMSYINYLEQDQSDYDGDIIYSARDVDLFTNGTDKFEILDPDSYEENVPTYRTRELAEMAEANGNDGVIIRNCYDIGGVSSLKGRNGLSDIFIAFSGEQVKDIRNTDPTNNPDIRYSIVDDEEAQSKMAYDDAMDTSYEALTYYESMISDIDEDDDGFINHPMQVYLESLQKYGESDEKARNAKNKYRYRPTAKIDNEEELINEFYAGLNSYTEYFVFDDPILEEGRKRMARSRSDFMERLNAEWDDRWLTEGEILDVNSVKKDVREMVKSIMRNADTPNKVKNDIVNKTLIDIRLAYQFAKKGRIDVADALLWHTSMRMIEGVEFVNDDTFNEYKDLREYLRTTRIQLGEEYWADVDYQAFRKNNFGRMKLVKGQTNVDEIYQEMCERWPEWFSEEEEMTPPDQLLQIEHVLDVIQPYKEAYSSEEAASIATDIAYDLSNIVYGKGRPYESLADKYKNRYDKQTQAMRQRHQEALNKVREQRDKGIKAERAKWQVREQKRKERQAHRKAFDSIVKNYNWLSERLLTNTKDKHIPEQYKKELAGLLAAFDLQTVGSKRVEERRGQKGKKTIKMEAMKKAINNIEAKSEFFHVNDSITDIIDELLGRDSDGAYKQELSIEGKTIDELTVDELMKIDKLLKSLKHEFTFYETVRTGAKRTQAADIGTAQVDSSLKHAELFGPGKDYNNITGALDKILNMDEMTPAYVFKRIDPNNTGIGMMFKELRRSFDKYVKNQKQLNGWMEEILSPYHRGGKLWKKYGAEEIENWRRAKATNTFKLQSGDEIRLTPAQMMSVYCLAKRPQAYQHMVGAGIVIKPVTYQAKLETDFKRKTNWALPTILSDGDIKMISTALTPEQKQVADQLQQLMATKMAAWGNEASRAVIGIDLFEDPDYFPIQSDRAALEEDFTADQFVDMIRNFGFTKAVQPGARNAIAIDDIFTVVSTHCNNMNLYNAYSESMNDFMKVYNYHALREDGSDYSVKQAIAHAYSQKATTFISTFMRDLNGNVSKGRVTGIDNMMNAALGNAKKASVFANGRVALQQPTAIMRAFAVISPKYLKGIKPSKGAMKEMFEHCPIALWKSWGYYDINMGKSIEDIMMNNGNWLEDKMTDIYGAADNVTWTAIWQMCKSEVKDKNPKVKEGSDEFWDLVNERMSEVVDFTQVVDSPFHRSHAMRDKQILVKMATSFMAEPTLTFNMVRDGLVNSYEMYKLGDKGGAAKLLGKTSRVFVLSAFATAAAAAIWDAVRGKQPDGDDDEEGNAFDLWWANTIANFQDNLKLWNNIYYIKDIASLFDGWGTSNLALQGWKQLADGYAQLTGAYRVNSKKTWWENMLAGIGYLSGTPFGTILKDGKALMNIFGIHPSFLSDIGEHLDSVQDMLGGSSSGSGVGGTSSNNESNNKKAGSDETDAASSAVRLWTYDDAPFKVENGSVVDNFLNHFGVNLTSAEILAAEAKQAQKEHEKQVEKITKSLSEYSGEEYDKHLWDKSDLEGYGKAIEEGDFERAAEIEKLFTDCGGSKEFIDAKKLYHYKKNYVKSIVYDPTDAQIEQQTQMKQFLLSHGMSEAELSEKVYKSQTRKELQVAFRINDEDAIVEELTPLIRAGLSYDDFVKAYKNRNRIDIKKYKDSDGKYAERLKSTGTYNWPVTGTITSNFGHRSSPGGIGSTDHKGLDIGASMGTPVGAADGGTVVYAGWDGGYGKCVRIEHDDGTITEYAHLSWWDAEVGDTVAQGQTIGNVGSTGNSTGPHLHFGVKVNGSYVDPLTKLN